MCLFLLKNSKREHHVLGKAAKLRNDGAYGPHGPRHGPVESLGKFDFFLAPFSLSCLCFLELFVLNAC